MFKVANNSDYENIIQGCSMGADAVNLALLKMEKNHCTYNEPILDTYVANAFLLWFMNKTPQGTYLLKANADLTLRAGEYIDFVAVDGQEVDVLFDMEEGATIDIAVGYEQCNNNKSNFGGDDASGEDSVDEYAILFDTIEELREEEKTIALQVIPNPNTGLFSIQFTDRKEFDNYQIYSLSGVLIKSNTFEPLVLAQIDENLAKGTYVVIVSLDGKSYHQKLVVL